MKLIAGWIVAVSRFSGADVSAQAQTYPTREIRVVVGLPAGSGGDVVARFYADKLSQLAGKPVIVENRPGMILSLGADTVAKAAPDGYTILITSVTSSHAANLFNFKKLPYDPIKDFTPVATLQKSYFMLMTRAEAPWKTVAELTDAMKIKGDKASYGYGAPPALASAELYKARKDLKAVGIPYKTSMASLPEMFSGEIDFQFIDSTAGTPLLQGGKVRGLAVTAGQRVPGRRTSDHGRGRRHSGIRHRAGVGSLAAGRSARPDRRTAGIMVRPDQPDGGHPAVYRQHQRRAVSGRRQAIGRFHSQGNQEVGRAGQARENRAAVSLRTFP